MIEIWKDIPGYKGIYQISNHGRIKRIAKCNRSYSGRILSPVLNCGYFRVKLCVNGKQDTRKIHRLVLETFIGPCPDNCECCHMDGNSKNNHIENLRWDTRSNNMIDSVKHGTHVDNSGSNSSSAKLTESDVLTIRRLLEKGASLSELGKRFRVDFTTISMVKRRKTWKYI